MVNENKGDTDGMVSLDSSRVGAIPGGEPVGNVPETPEHRVLVCIFPRCGNTLKQTSYTGGVDDFCGYHRELAEFFMWLLLRVSITRSQPSVVVPKSSIVLPGR